MSSWRAPAILSVLFVAAACSGKSSGSADGGTPDAGADAGTAAAGPHWSSPVAVDSDPGAGLDLTAAVDPSGHAAAAYFTKTAPARYTLTLARDDGTGHWTHEAIPITSDSSDLASLPQLTGRFGLALAFDPQGQPALAFLGGGNADNKTGGDGRWTSFEGDAHADPLPSSAVIMRKGASGWTTQTVAKYSSDIVATGFAVDDKGVVTGLWAGLAFDPAGTIHAVFRDIHYGSDMSATAVSNLEYFQGDNGGKKLAGELIAGGRGDPMMLSGAGDYTKMVIVNGQPAVSFVLSPDTDDGSEQVWFAQRTGAGQWATAMVSAAMGETGMGPSLAYASGSGYAIAYYDGDQGDLVVAQSDNGMRWTPNTLEALGDTGQHPAAAFDAKGNLGVLYAFCRSPVEPAGSCSPSQELRFRAGDGDAEHVDSFVPETTALVVDGAGRFTALYRNPKGGLFVTVRTP